MDDTEKRISDECRNSVRTVLEAFEKIYGTETLYWAVDYIHKHEIRSRFRIQEMAKLREADKVL